MVGNFQRIADALQIVGKQFVAKVPGRSVDSPGGAGLFVEADDETPPLLAQVALALGVHHVRQLRTVIVHFCNVVSDKVLVLHGMQRQVNTCHFRDLARPQTRRVHYMLGDNGALLGQHLPVAIRPRRQAVHFVAQHDLRTLIASRFSVGVGGAGWVQMAIEGVVKCTKHTVGIRNRRQIANFRRAYDARIQPHIAVFCTLGFEEVQPFRVAGKRQPADMMQTARLAGDFFQFPIQPDGITLQRRHIGVGVQGMKSTRSVPGGSRRQFGTLDQHEVGPTEFGQVIQNAAANHAAADHRYLDL